MNILILGGTKFIGEALVKKLVKNKLNKIDILSKKKTQIKNINKQFLFKLEDKFLKEKKTYDLIIDFISSNKTQIANIKKNFSFKSYFYISTIWVDKKKKYTDSVSKNYNSNYLPTITRNYINYKLEVEKILRREFRNKIKILRLPIIFGIKSPRIQYYIDRIFYNKQIIQSKNFDKTHISYCDLPALIDFLVNFIKYKNRYKKKIYYIITGTISMNEFISKISKILKLDVKIFFYEKLFLLKKKYLFNDPFINEYKMNFLGKNLIKLKPKISIKNLINFNFINVINLKKKKIILNEVIFTKNYKTNEIKIFKR